MPIYEYECTQCHKHFEVRQKFSDAPLTTCESCGGEVKKLISATAFALKGDGWSSGGYMHNPTWYDRAEKYADKSLAKKCSYRAHGLEPPECCKVKD